MDHWFAGRLGVVIAEDIEADEEGETSKKGRQERPAPPGQGQGEGLDGFAELADFSGK